MRLVVNTVYRELISVHKAKRAILFLIATLSLCVHTSEYCHVAAEELMVYPGEYVIELSSEKKAFSNNSFNALQNEASEHLEYIEGIDNNTVLIKKSSFALQKALKNESSTTETRASSSEPVLFDTKDKYCDELIQSGIAKNCSPNFVIKTASIPNDTLYEQQWGLSSAAGIAPIKAWESSTGSAEVVVGVIDTGIDLSHPDLSPNLWVNQLEIPGNSIDDDLNGYIDDIHGVNFVRKDLSPNDDNGHGTHVAGIIGARGNNAEGITGVAWNVKLMALKFLDSRGAGSLAGALEAIKYVRVMRERGVNILITNNSWGGPGYSKLLEDAVVSLENARILFVAAAGNDGKNNDVAPQYPCNFKATNVISVGASGKNGSLAPFSNFGVNTVDIAAPGVAILSTWVGGQYNYLSGTSMAAPFVSGAFALLLSQNPGISPESAIELLKLRSIRTPELTTYLFQGGALNIANIFPERTAPLPPLVPTISPAPEQNAPQQEEALPALPVDDSPVVQSISAKKGDRDLTVLKGGQVFELHLIGKGTGKLQITPSVNGQKCGLSSEVLFSNGTYSQRIRVPAQQRFNLRSLSFETQNVKTNLKIRTLRFKNNSARKISIRRSTFQNICQSLTQAIK
jgi:subtilisin family serine protease